MRRLGTVTICGFKYKVLLAEDETDDPDLEGRWAYCDSKAQKIVLDSNMTEEGFEFHVIHETMHAIFEHSGALSFLADAVHKHMYDPAVGELEETLIRILTPHLRSTLKDFARVRRKLWT